MNEATNNASIQQDFASPVVINEASSSSNESGSMSVSDNDESESDISIYTSNSSSLDRNASISSEDSNSETASKESQHPPVLNLSTSQKRSNGITKHWSGEQNKFSSSSSQIDSSEDKHRPPRSEKVRPNNIS